MATQDTEYSTHARSKMPGGYVGRSPVRSPTALPLQLPPQTTSSQPSDKAPPTLPSSRQVPPRFPPSAPDTLDPTDGMRIEPGPRPSARKHWTCPQRLGGILIASICVFCAVWYVPRVISRDRRFLTGAVASSGVITLNFANAGELQKLNVHLGETVRKGQILATEYAPNTNAVVAAQIAAIASDHAKVASLLATVPDGGVVDGAELSADKAQLAFDQAQLLTDRVKVASTEIIAPSAGAVVAVNGQPGEIVTAAGIRYYAVDSQEPAVTARPEFSLLPEGPQSIGRSSTNQSALPVIALRTSNLWRVVALVPESEVARVRSGDEVIISVPAAHITGVRGQVNAVLPTPLSTSAGTVYQGVITITGRAPRRPLNGMAADIELRS